MAEKENRCWPGYEPVKGKEPHEQGSCRKEAKGKTTAAGKDVQDARKRQIDGWVKDHPGAPRKAAQHLKKPKAAKKK